MRNLKSNISKIKTIAIAAMLLAMSAVDVVSYGQQKSGATLRVNDKYSMSPDSRFKPELEPTIIIGLSMGNISLKNFLKMENT